MKKLVAEFLPYMSAYRIYDPDHPAQTIAYEDNLVIAEQHAIDNGYGEIVILDRD